MTVIAWRERGEHIELAADSLTTEGERTPPFGPKNKFSKERGLILAASGLLVNKTQLAGQIISHAQGLAIGTRTIGEPWPEMSVVVLAKEGAFLVVEYQFYRLPWEAVGSGAGFARGYMIGGLSPKEAVTRIVEQRMNRYCGGPVQSITVNRQDLTSLASLEIYPASRGVD